MCTQAIKDMDHKYNVMFQNELFVCRKNVDRGLPQVAERHDSIKKLKETTKSLEEKHREALATVNHRGEVIKTLREEAKQAANRVRMSRNNYIR